MKKWATMSCNYPTCHLCGLWFTCNNLLTISLEYTYHPWCIEEYTQLCFIVLFLLWCHLYYKIVCNLGFKVRFQRCSRKGWAWKWKRIWYNHTQWKHPTFHFKHVKHTFEYILLFTCLCYLFPFICVLYFKIYGLQESNFHCSLLVFNHDAHELI